MRRLERGFILRVTAFLGRSGLSPTAFGMKALGDPNLMREIERGRSLTLRSADQVLDFMDEHDGIPRGARAPPRRPRYRKPSPRARRAKTTKRSRAMNEQPRSESAHPPIRILRLPEVLARTGLSRSTIYLRIEQGRFPRPVPLGGRAVGWIESEIDEWIRERIAESRGDADEGGERGEGGAVR